MFGAWTVAAVVAATVLAAGATARADRKAPTPIDYQKLADVALWSFLADRATVKWSAEEVAKPYKVRTAEAKRAGLSIVIACGDEDLYAWTGHAGSVFAVSADVLYYAEYGPTSSGCSVTAYDLKAGKQLWQTRLKGLGPIDHTGYRNRVNIAADANVVRVFGNESAGGYVEFVSRATGKTVGHRVFKREEMKAEE